MPRNLSNLERDVGTDSYLIKQKPVIRKRACNYLSFAPRPTSLNPKPFPPVLTFELCLFDYMALGAVSSL